MDGWPDLSLLKHMKNLGKQRISSSLGYWPQTPILPSTILAFEQDLLGAMTKQTSLVIPFLDTSDEALVIDATDQTKQVSPVHNDIAHF